MSFQTCVNFFLLLNTTGKKLKSMTVVPWDSGERESKNMFECFVACGTAEDGFPVRTFCFAPPSPPDTGLL